MTIAPTISPIFETTQMPDTSKILDVTFKHVFKFLEAFIANLHQGSSTTHSKIEQKPSTARNEQKQTTPDALAQEANTPRSPNNKPHSVNNTSKQPTKPVKPRINNNRPDYMIAEGLTTVMKLIRQLEESDILNNRNSGFSLRMLQRFGSYLSDGYNNGDILKKIKRIDDGMDKLKLNCGMDSDPCRIMLDRLDPFSPRIHELSQKTVQALFDEQADCITAMLDEGKYGYSVRRDIATGIYSLWNMEELLNAS